MRFLAVVIGAIVAAASLVVAPVGPAAARVDAQACPHEEDRLVDADAFALDVCFDGTTLFVMNRTDIPVHVFADGAGPPYQRAITVPPPVSLAYVYTHPAERNLLMPGYRLEFPVGPTGVSVRTHTTDHGRGYAVLRAVSTVLPDELLVGVPDKVIDLVNDLVRIFDEHQACLSNSGPVGDIGCEASYYGRIVFSVGTVVAGIAARGLVGAVLNLFDLVTWADNAPEDRRAIEEHGTFSITASPPATQPPATQPPATQPPATQPPATQPPATQPPTGSPTISLSQGGAAPAGYWYSVTASGFTPGSKITLTCRDSVDPQGFWSQEFTVAGDGRASDATLCYSADGPDHWVTAGSVESNHVSW